MGTVMGREEEGGQAVRERGEEHGLYGTVRGLDE